MKTVPTHPGAASITTVAIATHVEPRRHVGEEERGQLHGDTALLNLSLRQEAHPSTHGPGPGAPPAL